MSRVLREDGVDGKLSIGRLFTHFAEVRPDDEALVDDRGDTETWRQLDLVTNRLARSFAAAGVTADDAVAVILPNSTAFFRACIAAWKLGATVVPVSTRLTAEERQRILDLARPALVVGELEAADVLGSAVPVHPGHLGDTTESDEPLPDVAPTFWKALTSGGSTGLPKLIVSHDPPYYDPGVSSVTYMHPDGVQLVCGPLYHNAAFIYASRGLFCGQRLVIMSRFDPARALELVARHRVTWLQLVPTMMNRIRRLPADVVESTDVSSIRTLLHVGGPCPPALKRTFIEWLGPECVVEVYAGTESQGITMIDGVEWLQHPGSVGRAIRGSAFRVLDEAGRDVEPGEVGEIFLMPAGGPGSTYHYVGATPRSRDGWESLGDLGRFDEDGFLYLADRSTDCIVSGGANVYPAEVEAALEALPGVHAAAVIGLPDDDLGQRVVALVEPETGARLPADELDRLVRGTLSGPRRPRAYELVTGPLRDEAGKVRRSALRDARRPGGPAAGREVLPSAPRWRDLRTGASAVDAILAVLDVEPDGPDVFVGTSLAQPSFRIFGGQVLAQAAVAATRTVEGADSAAGATLHSLHGHFLRTGAPLVPVHLEVSRLHDGRSFHVRRIDVRQDGRLIATVTASFQAPEHADLSHQLEEPPVAGPEGLAPRFPFPLDDAATPPGPFELRESPLDPGDEERPVDVWIRVAAALPDDPQLHQALIIHLSDYSVTRQAFRRHHLRRGSTQAASLDHAIWLHRPARADRWLHYRTSSPSAEGHRALGLGALFGDDGRMAASTAQQMLVRPLERPPGEAPTAPA